MRTYTVKIKHKGLCIKMDMIAASWYDVWCMATHEYGLDCVAVITPRR